MKRLFSVLMVAAIATFTFAFTTPKSATFDSPYKLVGSVWQDGIGAGCSGNVTPCQFTSSVPLTEAQRAEAAGLIGNDASDRPITGSFGTIDVFDIDLKN